MSGSGGSGYDGGFERVAASCEDLVINTQIGSPRADVLKLLQVGTVLVVQVQQQNGISVVVLTLNGQLAGGVASPDLQRLRECILSGTVYHAFVTSISGAYVGVRISAEPLP